MSANLEVVIEEHKNWNTKKLYVNGRLMMTYRRQPKKIWFKSKMVNDTNQFVCGGWGFPGMQELVAEQLLAGKKPLGDTGSGLREDVEKWLHYIDQMEAAGLIVHDEKHGTGISVTACQPILVRDIGDLDKLKLDYAGFVDPEEIEYFEDMPLNTFLEKHAWHVPKVPQWLSGLLLGYPIENTISLFLQ